MKTMFALVLAIGLVPAFAAGGAKAIDPAKLTPGKQACEKMGAGNWECYFTPKGTGPHRVEAHGRIEKEDGHGNQGDMNIAWGEYQGDPAVKETQCAHSHVDIGNKNSVGVDASCTLVFEHKKLYKVHFTAGSPGGRGVIPNEPTIREVAKK